jgi:hypothetical protein
MIEQKTTTQITQEHRKFLKEIRDNGMSNYLHTANKLWTSNDSLIKHFIDSKKKIWTWEELVTLMEKKNE